MSAPTFGGGWSQYATPGTLQAALQQQLQQGVTGQAAVDALNQNPATSGIAYYADSGDYGLPNGFYAAPNAAGALDLIQRSGGNGSPSPQSTLASTLATGQPTAIPQVGMAPGFQPFTPLDQRGSQRAQATLAALLAGGTRSS